MFKSYTNQKNASSFALLATMTLLMLLGIPGMQQSALSQDVSVSYSGKETWVGVPIRITFSVSNASDVGDPQLPSVDGLDIQYGGAVNTTSSISIINGVRSESRSVELAIDITPEYPGTFNVPPIKLEVDGTERSTNTFTFEAIEATNGDRLFVDIIHRGGPVYVGEPIKLDLRIWIKPFHSERYDTTVSERTMWRLIRQSSKWGPFREALEELARSGRRPSGRLVQRAEGEYYLYEIQRELRPTGTGMVEDLDDVVISISYPTGITRSRMRSLLRSDMEFTGLMPITERAKVAEIDVQPLPEEGRPEYFRGAVGEFIVRAGARPTDVAVGDPITLTFLVGTIDGDGTVLETLRPPPLAEIKELTDSFRIPKDPIAGDLEDTLKIFTQTLRPLSDDVTEIPPIPFSFFDPKEGEYRTIYTQAIPIEVTPAETLAAADIVRANNATSSKNDPDTPESANDADSVETGLRANFAVDRRMLASSTRTLGVTTAAILFVPPACFAIVAFIAVRRRWKDSHPALVRSRGARRRALTALKQATDLSDIGLAVRGYVSDRAGRPATSLTSAEATRLAQKAGAEAPTLLRMDELLTAAQRAGYGGSSESTTAQSDEAAQVVRELDHCHWNQPEEVTR